jgi:hypothetical protein
VSIEYRLQGNGISKGKSPNSEVETLPCIIWFLVPEDKIPSIVTLRPSSSVIGLPATLHSNKMLFGLVFPAMQMQVLSGPCQIIHLFRPGLEAKGASQVLGSEAAALGREPLPDGTLS